MNIDDLFILGQTRYIITGLRVTHDTHGLQADWSFTVKEDTDVNPDRRVTTGTILRVVGPFGEYDVVIVAITIDQYRAKDDPGRFTTHGTITALDMLKAQRLRDDEEARREQTQRALKMMKDHEDHE